MNTIKGRHRHFDPPPPTDRPTTSHSCWSGSRRARDAWVNCAIPARAALSCQSRCAPERPGLRTKVDNVGLLDRAQQKHLVTHVEAGQRMRENKQHATGLARRRSMVVTCRSSAWSRTEVTLSSGSNGSVSSFIATDTRCVDLRRDCRCGVLACRVQLLEHLRDDRALLLCGVGRQPQVGGIHRLVDGELALPVFAELIVEDYARVDFADLAIRFVAPVKNCHREP
jgi:hypothetical protein